MASYVVRGLGVIAAAGAIAVSAAQPAEASVTLGPCTVTALTPTPIVVAGNGKKLAAGRASARCTFSRQLYIETRLYGDDLLIDDVIYSGVPFHEITVGPTLQTVGRVRMCSNPGEAPAPCTGDISCDEDIGADELYSRVRARLRVAGSNPPVYGLWTAWTNGPTVTYYC
jgi:hypothetical protein